MSEVREHLKVRADGELVVLVASGVEGRCEVRMRHEEAERFYDAVGRCLLRVMEAREGRLAREAGKIDGVDEDEEVQE